MTDTAQRLDAETEKWEEKLHDRLASITAADAEGEDLLENVRAYRDDVQHFRDEDDPVRAFEAVIWAWSWLEIGERLGHITEE